MLPQKMSRKEWGSVHMWFHPSQTEAWECSRNRITKNPTFSTSCWTEYLIISNQDFSALRLFIQAYFREEELWLITEQALILTKCDIFLSLLHHKVGKQLPMPVPASQQKGLHPDLGQYRQYDHLHLYHLPRGGAHYLWGVGWGGKVCGPRLICHGDCCYMRPCTIQVTKLSLPLTVPR